MLTTLTLDKRLTKITAAHNDVALSYPEVRGLHLLAAIFVATIVFISLQLIYTVDKHISAL